MAEVVAATIVRIVRENLELLKNPNNFARITRLILEQSGYDTRKRTDQECHDFMQKQYYHQLKEAEMIITRETEPENFLDNSTVTHINLSAPVSELIEQNRLKEFQESERLKNLEEDGLIY